MYSEAYSPLFILRFGQTYLFISLFISVFIKISHSTRSRVQGCAKEILRKIDNEIKEWNELTRLLTHASTHGTAWSIQTWTSREIKFTKNLQWEYGKFTSKDLRFLQRFSVAPTRFLACCWPLECTSWTIMVHNRDQAENFQNSLIEVTGKAAFQASNLSIKLSRPLLSVLNTDKEVFYPLEVNSVDFFFQNILISPFYLLVVRASTAHRK